MRLIEPARLVVPGRMVEPMKLDSGGQDIEEKIIRHLDKISK